jgi:histidyl-tRNA synthetase
VEWHPCVAQEAIVKKLIQAVKGTRDFYPEQMAVRTWLYNNIRTVSERFGYQEYEGPILEYIALYAAKSGEELVKEQSFVLTDRGGDELTLRPELTPTLARMVAQKQNALPKPIRWWSFGPFWRYERPQKGRTREFFQWNIDLIGSNSIQADAEIAAVGAEFFRSVGLGPDIIRIQVNSRRLMDAQLRAIGVASEQVSTVFKVIDKREKMNDKAWSEYAASVGLSESQITALRAMLSNRELWKQSDELIAFFEAVADLGVGDYFEFESSIVRGLDYYTGTVMEARDRDGEFRAILGGGRYDNLVADVGGDPLPAVGFAMGDVVVGLVLLKYGKLPALRTSPAQVLIAVFDASLLSAARKLAAQWRAAGLRVELYPDAAKLDRQLKYADAKDIPFVAILGPDEAAKNSVTLKDLRKKSQRSVAQNEVAQLVNLAD